MILGQVPAGLDAVWEHGVSAAVISFVGGCVVWWLRRTYGRDGTDTKKAANDLECMRRNTKTTEKLGTILVSMEDSAERQAVECGKHVARLDSLCKATEELVRVHTDPKSMVATVETERKLDESMASRVAYQDHMHGKYGDLDPSEWRIGPLIEMGIEAVDTVGTILDKLGCGCPEDIGALRAKMEARRDKVEGKRD